MHYIKYFIATFAIFMFGCLKVDRVPNQGSVANMDSVSNTMAGCGMYGSTPIMVILIVAGFFLVLGLMVRKK